MREILIKHRWFMVQKRIECADLDMHVRDWRRRGIMVLKKHDIRKCNTLKKKTKTKFPK